MQLITIKSLLEQNLMVDPGALIVYGNGADLGNFRYFADDLKSMSLIRKYKTVGIVHTPTRDAFFAAIEGFGRVRPIAELHVFCHSLGGGLAFGYGSELTNHHRDRISAMHVRAKRKISYLDFLNAEIGILFTDDLLRNPYISKKAFLRSIIAPRAIIKLWGCNSGIANWRYSDSYPDGTLVYEPWIDIDPENPAFRYWWRALNTHNVPKPSIAQAIADFFGKTTFGAYSGSSIQVLYKEKWISSHQYKLSTTKWPGEAQIIRLHPDKGNYTEFKPRG